MSRILLVCVLAAPAVAAPVVLVDLVEHADAQPAPPAVLKLMAKTEQKRLATCRARRETVTAWSRLDEASRLVPFTADFGALVVDLDGDEHTDYLVFPTGSCTDFFGAHAVGFWLLRGTGAEQWALVGTGAEDTVELAPSRHHGLRDLFTVYGVETTELRFDGRRYRRAR